MLDTFNPEILYFVAKHCDASWILRPTGPIDFNDLTFVMQGEAVYRIDGAPFTVHAGEAIFIPRGKTRAAETDGMDCMAFNFRSHLVLDGVLPSVCLFRNCPAVDYWLREYKRSWLISKTGLKGKAAFMMLFWEVYQLNAVEKIHPHVERMKQYIADHITDPFSLNQLARSVRLHPVYCESLFRKFMQCTPAYYHTRLRILQAMELLTHEDFSVSYIAQQLGYADASYFSRVFKKMQGVSPRDYRWITRK